MNSTLSRVDGAPQVPPGTGWRSVAVDYYELYDLVALQFAHVRMIGLVPFVGVALAELGLEDHPTLLVLNKSDKVPDRSYLDVLKVS